mmetsp:Transcript_28362/g.45764  ORF Transcript_28362/g.45764 Transcript_28362/m.45764 type:complete len:98 (-) Transcript_28362:293-586(-)
MGGAQLQPLTPPPPPTTSPSKWPKCSRGVAVGGCTWAPPVSCMIGLLQSVAARSLGSDGTIYGAADTPTLHNIAFMHHHNRKMSPNPQKSDGQTNVP